MEEMMNRKSRFAISLALALMVAALLSNVALAFECTNPNMNDNAVIGVFDAATGTFTPNKPNWGSFETFKFHGAWVKIVFPWGQSFNIFVHGVLPDGALDSGPGENGCDGKGIDDIEACLAMVP
jgi:hypothetical protein